MDGSGRDIEQLKELVVPSESVLPSLAQDDLEDLVAAPSVSVETILSIPTDPPAETSTVPESTGQGTSGSVETPTSEGGSLTPAPGDEVEPCISLSISYQASTRLV